MKVNQFTGATVWAIVPAAGAGRRMAQSLPKQYLPLLGKTVIEHTLNRLLSVESIAGVVVALADSDQRFRQLSISQNARVMTTKGGYERSDSVLSGLNFLQKKAKLSDWVLVHDAARCCVRPEAISSLITVLHDSDVGGILAVPASDTLKQVNSSNSSIERTIDRRTIWQAQTPQLFRYGLLREALQQAEKQQITDESSAVELVGYQPRVIQGHYDNIKITHPEDLVLAEAIIKQQELLI